MSLAILEVYRVMPGTPFHHQSFEIQDDEAIITRGASNAKNNYFHAAQR